MYVKSNTYYTFFLHHFYFYAHCPCHAISFPLYLLQVPSTYIYVGYTYLYVCGSILPVYPHMYFYYVPPSASYAAVYAISLFLFHSHSPLSDGCYSLFRILCICICISQICHLHHTHNSPVSSSLRNSTILKIILHPRDYILQSQFSFYFCF